MAVLNSYFLVIVVTKRTTAKMHDKFEWEEHRRSLVESLLTVHPVALPAQLHQN